MQLGAIVANATEREICSIEEWSVPLGRAYMIYDDFLNITGVGQTYGKEINGDILERELILIHLLRNCSAEKRKSVATIYSKEESRRRMGKNDRSLTLWKNTVALNMHAERLLNFPKGLGRFLVKKQIRWMTPSQKELFDPR